MNRVFISVANVRPRYFISRPKDPRYLVLSAAGITRLKTN
jgi:hypothetical protein